MKQTREDCGTQIVPIALDPDTLARLVAFARAIGQPPHDTAAELLRDLLADDAFWNAAAGTTTRPN